MARYPQGQPVRLKTTVLDSTVVPAVPIDAGALTLTVRKPDLTQQTYNTPAHDGLGLYHQDVPAADLTQLGHYQYVWTATGAGAGVSSPAGFEVIDPFEVLVLSLQDAKDALNIPQANTTDDAELQRKLASIGSSLERFTGGPILNRSVTERVDATSSPWELRLMKRPLVAVTSVTDVATGAVIDISDTEVDTNAGFLRRKSGIAFGGVSQIYTVVYTAGWGTAVPPAIADAATVIMQHLWENQRGGATIVPSQGGNEMTTLPGFGYMIPNLAAEQMAPYARVGAVA